MKKAFPVIGLIAVIQFLGYSCRKGELAPEHYQAGVVVKSSQLSSSDLDVRFDEASGGDTLSAGGTIDKIYDVRDSAILHGKPARMRIYKTGTSDLVADTSFVLLKNEQKVFNVIYSDVLGMGGFINGSDVPADSIRIRVVYHDKTGAQSFKQLEMQFYQYAESYPYVDTTDNVSVILPLQDGQYSADFYIPVYRKDQTTNTFIYLRIKDPVSGQWLLWFPDFPAYYIGMDSNNLLPGGYYFCTLNVQDNYSDGGVSYYSLDYSYLQL